jgi:hypothetical protein
MIVAALGLLAMPLLGAYRWHGRSATLRARLEAARVPIRTRTVDYRELEGLPPPVQRYFRAALQEGTPLVAAVTVHHAGEFNIKESGERWAAFTSTQRVVTQRPGFLWDGRIAMMPGIMVRVHDAYVAGEGILHPALFGLIALADLHDRHGPVAQGELMRFLAEAPWYPTALLPSQGLRWEPVDDRSARATLVEGALTVTLVFRFRDDGLIDSVYAEARGRTVGDRVVPTPWEARLSEYHERHGMQVPLSGEAAWLPPEGRQPYWRGHMTEVAYELVH